RTIERDEARALLTAASANLADTATALAKATGENENLTAANANLTAKNEAAAEQLNDAANSRTAHAARGRRALALEGAIWTQRTMAGTPRFVPLDERRTPIVSVLNLKGGVGKTTVTAYLARALAASGYRILLVDLDLQGSLSSLFIDTLEL